MEQNKYNGFPVLVLGDDKLTYSIAVNLLNTGHKVTLVTANRADVYHNKALHEASHELERLAIVDTLPDNIHQRLVICITEENVETKTRLIRQLEQRVSESTIIAINTESIALDELQKASKSGRRILGLNWSYPAQHTFFLEIIGNDKSDSAHIRCIENLAKEKWCKDPYVVRSGFSARARIMAAWAREAFYLVENEYASIESIDRACRNDAGYYLPFAGNFRYMDLMGTYAYGVVMKDLNPELSKAAKVPQHILADFHQNEEIEKGRTERLFQQFSQEVRDLIIKYSHEKIDC